LFVRPLVLSAPRPLMKPVALLVTLFENSTVPP